MGTPETRASTLPTAAPHAAGASRAPAIRFDPAVACALLEGPDVDAGLRYLLRGLEQEPPLRDPAWSTLLALLSQIPFVAAARDRATACDRLAVVCEHLQCAAATDAATRFGHAAERWFRAHSATARALHRRTEWLAARLAALAARGNGHVVGLYAAPAPEFDALTGAVRARLPVTFVEFDERAIAALRARHSLAHAAVQRASLADVLGGTYRAFDCELVYAPTLAAHLPTATASELLDAVLGWLRPGGAVVLPVHTAVPEDAFLAHVVGCVPNVVSPRRLLRGFAARSGIVVRVEDDPGAGLAYVILERPR